MGTTKMLHMKESKKGNPARHLKNSIEYIFAPPERTGNGRWVGGNCGTDPKTIYESMMQVKEDWGRVTNKDKNRRQGYHFVLTFPPGEVTEQLAFEIVSEFCEKYFGEELQYTFAIHNDQAHMHGHIIFNSVKLDGKMYRYENGDWEKTIQPLVNEICAEHGCVKTNLKSEDPSRRKNTQKGQGMNRYELIRQDIDKAIALSETYEDFLQCLQKNGYAIRKGESKKYGQYISFSPSWDAQTVRSYRLGAGYTVKSIRERIQNKAYDKKYKKQFSK